jgi:nucleoside-diphosphate-sugar epimerase
MKVFLTGGSGFLGSWVAEQLTAEGHTVRALVRPRSDKRSLEKLPRLEFAPGAVEDPASLKPAMKGVDAVVHVAGIVKARRAAGFLGGNTQGAKNRLEAA